MKGKSVIHGSNTNDERGTPIVFFKLLSRYFPFDLDVAATKGNALCEEYYTKENDALSISWLEECNCVWCNPPYSKGNLGKFVDKIIKEAPNFCSIVLLTTAKTDTKWFHKALKHCTTCYLIKGRLKFTGTDSAGNDIENAAPFPSALWVFGYDGLKKARGWRGKILPLCLKPTFRGF